MPFSLTFNPNNPKTLPNVKQNLENLKNFRSNEKRIEKIVDYKRKAPNLKRILCKTSFSQNSSNLGVKDCGRSYFCSKGINKDGKHTFKIVSEKFEVRVSFS